MNETEFLVEFYLEDLKSKFLKIDPTKYYLSYSGGRDSHLLYWFLKEWLKNNDYEMYLKYSAIKIVGVNTYMEHPQILKRIHQNCDIVLMAAMKPFDIKEKYGIPCFSKAQDKKIRFYQSGLRGESLMHFITRDTPSKFNLNTTASKLVLSGELHKVSELCCKYLKKVPQQQYEKESNRHAILGITAGEGINRQQAYKSCFTKDLKFTPLWDLSKEVEKKIYEVYKIETPAIYQYIERTGCMGCPYGSFKGSTPKELLLVTPNQYKFLWRYFKESYEVLGIPHYTEEQRQTKKQELAIKQLSIFDFIA